MLARRPFPMLWWWLSRLGVRGGHGSRPSPNLARNFAYAFDHFIQAVVSTDYSQGSIIIMMDSLAEKACACLIPHRRSWGRQVWCFRGCLPSMCNADLQISTATCGETTHPRPHRFGNHICPIMSRYLNKVSHDWLVRYDTVQKIDTVNLRNCHRADSVKKSQNIMVLYFL